MITSRAQVLAAVERARKLHEDIDAARAAAKPKGEKAPNAKLTGEAGKDCDDERK